MFTMFSVKHSIVSQIVRRQMYSCSLMSCNNKAPLYYASPSVLSASKPSQKTTTEMRSTLESRYPRLPDLQRNCAHPHYWAALTSHLSVASS